MSNSQGFLRRPFEVKALDETGQLAGYGSVFHVEDSYSDIVMPGAFARSLKERMPKMLWMHNTSQPIGVWKKAAEDEHGLYLEGQIAIDTALGGDAYKLLKMGALDGLSIGFSTKAAEYDDKKGIRKLIDVDLYEVSPVTFPANEEARVESVKADPRDIRELEAILRDAGLSRKEAKALLADGFKAIKPNIALRDAAADDEVLAGLKRLAAVIHP